MILNIRYNLHASRRKWYNIGLTIFLYCIRTKIAMRELGREISDVNVYSIIKYLIIRVQDRYRNMSLIIVSHYVVLCVMATTRHNVQWSY